jgi:hypothetical protein
MIGAAGRFKQYQMRIRREERQRETRVSHEQSGARTNEGGLS